MMDDEDALCYSCNGSGQGRYDGTTCWCCRGSGIEPQQCDDEGPVRCNCGGREDCPLCNGDGYV